MRPLRSIALVAILAAGSAVSGFAAEPEETFGESTQVVVVEVPVQVTRVGEPVRGLTADDFEVWDGRRKQVVTGFEVVDLSAAGEEAVTAAELPESARRHFLVLFDLTFSDLDALDRARGAMLAMVDSLHPADLVAVGSWSNRLGTQLVQDFTSDRARIVAALDSLGSTQLLDNLPPDPLRMASAEGSGGSRSFGPRPEGKIARVDRGEIEAEADEILATIERKAEEARMFEVSRAVQDMSRTMTGFAQAMSRVRGRKHVVWLSQGFEPAVLASGPQGARTLNAVERMLEELRRADCAVQVVDIAGLRGLGRMGGERVAGQEVLLNFAKSTGGELYEKTNDLAGSMRQMLRRTGVTYVLSFQPEKLGNPETFHRLRVKLKNQPRGTRVVHRPGWYAPRPIVSEKISEEI